MELDKATLEERFYLEPFFFSYSSISKFLYSPQCFYKHYVLGQKDDISDQYTQEGKLIHLLLFEPQRFNDKYIVAMDKLPSDNIKKLIDHIFKNKDDRTELSEYTEEILNYLKDVDLYQKMSKDTQLDKVLTSISVDYFNYLKNNVLRKVIDAETYTRCLDIVELISKHPVYTFMGLHDGSSINEMDISIKTEPIYLKGIVDNIKLDHDNKIIYINDLKTTSKTLREFPETVNYYNYWIQAAIYERLVRSLYDVDDTWKTVFSFVVIDKYNSIYRFEVSEDTMTNWQLDLQDVFSKLQHHYKNRDFSLPYEFLIKDVIL